jgi:DNA polymerase
MAQRQHHPGAAQFVPDTHRLGELAKAAARCEGCDLYARATQTIFGAGPATAPLMLVGEQPGDVEDTEGLPFVGPAGAVLDHALRDAGIERDQVWLTNAVKHFRWKRVAGSKRRIHDKPTAAQSAACRPWLAAELHAVRPAVVVALGAVAAGSLYGPAFRLTQHRGRLLPWPPGKGDFASDETPVRAALATIHPSAVLRADDQARDDMFTGLVDDLRLARRSIADDTSAGQR